MKKTITIDLPYWTGVSNMQILDVVSIPFSIKLDKNGSYKQTGKETINKIINNYSNESYVHITTPPGESSWGNLLAKKNIDYLRKSINLGGKKVLDIAGVDSYIANLMFEEDCIDSYTLVNPNLCTKNYLNPRIRCIDGYFPDAIDARERFDVVLLFNCLEHVPNPQKFLKCIKNIMSDEGILIIKTSDDTNLLLNGDFNVFLHEHLFYFTKESFNVMVRKVGLQIISSCSEFDSVLAVVVKNKGEDIVDSNIRPYSFDLSIFSKQLKYAEKLFRNLIQDKVNFIFHGACLGLVTLNQLLKPNVDISNVQVVDIDENKSGKFLPGFKKAILLPNKINQHDVDMVVVGSASFINPIKEYWMSRGIKGKNIITTYKQLV